MNYQSTRNKTIKINAAQAIKQGISTEGGLFVPESIPAMGIEEISALKDMNYQMRAVTIL